MQHEFNNRIEAQRAILRVINQRKWNAEQLFGLSTNAIDRWITANRLDPTSRLVRRLKVVSGKLFFLANKSQEQISDEYVAVRAEIVAACDEMKMQLNEALG